MSRHTIWSKQKIGKLVQPARKPVEVCADQTYREIGIRSHGKGIFYKDEVLGLDLGSKRVFWVEPGCFVVNIVFAWEQAVAKTTDAEKGMIASHRFPMYRPLTDKIDLDYLLYFFKTPHGKYLLELASPGGAGRNKTLGQEAFLELAIPVPPIEEQRKIAEILSTWDEAIRLTQELIAAKQHRKKGLMQRLLTGQVRFPGFEEQPWRTVSLTNITKIILSNVDKKTEESETPVRLCNYMDVFNNPYIANVMNFMEATATPREIERFTLQKNDVIITKDSETREEIAEPTVVIDDLDNVLCGYHLAILRPDPKQVFGPFLKEMLLVPSVRHQFVSKANGITRFGLTQDTIHDISLQLPSEEEQHRIAAVLQACDHEIQLLQQKLAALQQQKKGLMQRLLTGQVRVQLDNSLEARTPLPELTIIEYCPIRLADWYHQENGKYPTRIASQKMPYLFQASTGINLGFAYERHKMGPYSSELHRLWEKMEGVYIAGYGDGSEAAEIQPSAEAVHAANIFFHTHPELETAFARFTQFVKGFETAFGLELLATVHWLMQEIPNASFEQIVQSIHEWNPRKNNRYRSEKLIRKAWNHLRQLEVDT